MRRSSSLLSLAEPLAPFIAAWTSLYLLARFVLFRQRSADFANRVVSVVHALAAILLAVPALDWSAPLGRVGLANTAAQARAPPRRLAPPAAEPAPRRADTLHDRFLGVLPLRPGLLPGD